MSYINKKQILLYMLMLLMCVNCTQKRTLAPVSSRNTSNISSATNIKFTNKSDKYYIVNPGDTLYSIGFRFGHGYKRLSEWNNIAPPYDIEIGQRLRLFNPHQHKKTQKISKKYKKPPSTAKKRRSPSQKKPIYSSSNKKVLKLVWQWPINGAVIKTFSQTAKKGIDILGSSGQIVRAAEAGKVVYSGDALIGYGNLLIIKHNYLYLSAYANNRRLLVKEGQLIEKGQSIAEVGKGNGNRPALHFEIRKNGKPVNPMRYLPKK